MSTLSVRPTNIWLRSFYGFDPEDDGYIGWSVASHRDRMLGKVADGDLFMIYGANSSQTAKSQRNRVIGFLQVEGKAIRDIEKMSVAGLRRKIEKGWKDNWTHALPAVRAWRADEAILLERIAPVTYRTEAGQAIAVWSPPLLVEEVELALKVKVTEVNVFGEPPVTSGLREVRLAQAFQPSRAFPASFGTRTSEYVDGPTLLYLARYEGDAFALLGRSKPQFASSVLVKIGISNDTSRRLEELNSGFPPAARGKWTMQIISEPYVGREAAEAAEQAFKDNAVGHGLQSLGGEFFEGDWIKAQIAFSTVGGVSAFGK